MLVMEIVVLAPMLVAGIIYMQKAIRRIRK